jgi:hypothetical protein
LGKISLVDEQGLHEPADHHDIVDQFTELGRDL